MCDKFIYANIIEVSMINTNDNHAIIKNRFGKKTNGIQDILKFLGKIYLFIYSKIIYSGKCTSGSNFIPFYSQKRG